MGDLPGSRRNVNMMTKIANARSSEPVADYDDNDADRPGQAAEETMLPLPLKPTRFGVGLSVPVHG